MYILKDAYLNISHSEAIMSSVYYNGVSTHVFVTHIFYRIMASSIRVMAPLLQYIVIIIPFYYLFYFLTIHNLLIKLHHVRSALHSFSVIH